MKNLGYIASEITKGKNLSDNLVKYGKGLSSLYNGLAYIKMSMNYYTILNMIKDNEIDDELFLEMFQGVNEIIEISSIDSAVASEDVLTDKISSLRNRLIAIMESITDYVDKFKIYEYVLNRVEYRFKDDELDEEYYNTYMTNDIMHYILSDKDNVSINGRISEMVGQLPIRMSKVRFYDHIKDAFTSVLSPIVLLSDNIIVYKSLIIWARSTYISAALFIFSVAISSAPLKRVYSLLSRFL